MVLKLLSVITVLTEQMSLNQKKGKKMGIKDKLNQKLNETLSKTEGIIQSSIKKTGGQETKEVVKEAVGNRPCSACGAPVPIDSVACSYCSTANVAYANPTAPAEQNNTFIQTERSETITIKEVYVEDQPMIKCPHCNSPMAIKKKRSATKHAAAAIATGGLSLATLAIPNKKYTCATCGKTFKK